MKAWIGAVALVGTFANGGAMAADGNTLLSQCKIAIRGDANVESYDALQAGLCIGLIQGVRQTMLTYVDMLPKQERACFPERMTNNQGTRVVVKYLEDHPKSLHYPDTLLAMAAYRDAFPCKY
ncbi:Rap1a/Tai family immunity protein [Pseudomonas lini]